MPHIPFIGKLSDTDRHSCNYGQFPVIWKLSFRPFCSLLPDQEGKEAIPRPASRETTARGAALLAGLAEGVWGTLEELTALSQETERFAPSAERGGAEALYGAWSAAVERARSWAQG